MKNLIETTRKNRIQDLETFKKDLNKIKTHKEFNTLFYKNLLPKGKKIESIGTIKETKAYLITRKEKKVYKSIEQEVNEIKEVYSAGELVDIKINIEWYKSKTWGYCPTGEAWMTFKTKDGLDSKYVKVGGITGCGYDKKSTAVAQLLNQFTPLLKRLYIVKNQELGTRKPRSNRDLLGYGSGYGILPRFEGGVGVNCYPKIFDRIGFRFECVASGQTFDVYQTVKK